MKPKSILCQLLLAFLFVLFSSTISQSAEPTKVLINILKDRQVMGTVKIVDVNWITSDYRTAETLLAKHLIGTNYQVVTSDDVTPSSWLTANDILDAQKGNMAKVRKVAAFYDCNLIFSGSIKTHVNSEAVLGLMMTKAITTISYRVVDTASGKILDIDSKKYFGARRSPEEARIDSFERMADEIAQVIIENCPPQMASKDRLLLAQYKKKIREKEKPITPVAVSALKPEQKKTEAESGIVYSVPQIIIIFPPLGRGFKVVEKRSAVTIEGLAKDTSGIEFVKINGRSADVDAEGYFAYKTNLTPGENKFLVMAMNKVGKTATKRFVFEHPKDKTPPEIVLINPQVTRGFTVVVKKPVRKINVEGLAKDDSGLLYLRVNGKDTSFDQEGHFSREIDLTGHDDKILVEAVDKVGNKICKEFRVARGDGDTRVLETSRKAASKLPFGIKPVLWGLAIGVSKYNSTAIDLKYADKDALSLAAFLKKQEGKLFSEVHFKTLVNESVTRNSVIENISTYLGRASQDDVVFIFLAGHGIKHRQSGSYYFIPYDADSRSILSKGLRMSDFDESVNILSKNVNKVIIAMDTCHAGSMQLGLRAGGGGENLAEALREASGLYILAASKSGEESLEDKNFKLHKKDSGHGAFTYALIKGMSGDANYDGDNYISLNELFQFVAKQVPRLTDGRQHPYFRTEGTDMPFILLK